MSFDLDFYRCECGNAFRAGVDSVVCPTCGLVWLAVQKQKVMVIEQSGLTWEHNGMASWTYRKTDIRLPRL